LCARERGTQEAKSYGPYGEGSAVRGERRRQAVNPVLRQCAARKRRARQQVLYSERGRGMNSGKAAYGRCSMRIKSNARYVGAQAHMLKANKEGVMQARVRAQAYERRRRGIW